MQPYFLDPITIEGMESLLETPPRIHKEQNRKPRHLKALRDPFTSLPAELVYEILDKLPDTDLLSLLMSSRKINNMSQDPFFWKRRIMVDMPWMWEFREKCLSEESGTVDWHAMYSLLNDHSYSGSWQCGPHQKRVRDLHTGLICTHW
jgi:hypothetical protein